MIKLWSSSVKVFNIQIILLLEVRSILGSIFRNAFNLNSNILCLHLRSIAQWNHSLIALCTRFRSLQKISWHRITIVITQLIFPSLFQAIFNFMIVLLVIVLSHVLSHRVFLLQNSLWAGHESVYSILKWTNQTLPRILGHFNVVWHPFIIFNTIEIGCLE